MRGKLTALLLAIIVVMGVALVRTATASHTSTHHAFSGGAGFKGLVVKTDLATVDITSVAPSWQTVDSRGFQIPAGESQLIVVDFSAEATCEGTSAVCRVRALVGRTLAGAEELEPSGNKLSFDSTGTDGAESHAMSQALCVRNATASPLDISVFLQAQKSSGDVTEFGLGDATFKIARNAPCSPTVDI